MILVKKEKGRKRNDSGMAIKEVVNRITRETSRVQIHSFLLYKNIFYKSIEAEKDRYNFVF